MSHVTLPRCALQLCRVARIESITTHLRDTTRHGSSRRGNVIYIIIVDLSLKRYNCVSDNAYHKRRGGIRSIYLRRETRTRERVILSPGSLGSSGTAAMIMTKTLDMELRVLTSATLLDTSARAYR